jgi:type I restriction enzyme, S subunit
MSEWPVKRLEELCADLTVGHVGSMASQYVAVGIPFLRSQNVRKGHLDLRGLKYISPEFHQQLRKSRLQSGDIVMVRTGEPGAAALIPGGFQELNCADLVIARPAAGVDPRFLCYSINATAERYISAHLVGAVQQHFNVGSARNLEISLPSLLEQRAIADILEALDDKIVANGQAVTTVEQLGCAIFSEYFTDALAYLASGRELPSGWSVNALGAVSPLLETGRRPKGGVSSYASGVPSIGAESITRLAVFDFTKVKYVPEDYFTSMKQGVIEDYDILLYKDGGRPGNFQPHVSMFGRGFPFERMCINEHVYRIRLADPLSQAYGYFWLTSIMAEMRSRGTGVAIPGLNSSAVRELPIVLPPASRLTQFEQAVLPLIDLALNYAAEARELSQLRDTLLPRLMSGNIRVREAEKAVEDVT